MSEVQVRGLTAVQQFELRRTLGELSRASVTTSSDSRFGEAALIALIVTAVPAAGMVLASWLAKARRSRRIEMILESELPDGSKHMAVIRVEQDEAVQLDSETMKALASVFRIPVADIVKSIDSSDDS